MEPHKKPQRHIAQILQDKIVFDRFVIMALFLCLCGVGILFFTGREKLSEVVRDIGIGLLVAGTVGLAVDFAVRKEIKKDFRNITRRAIKDLTKPRFEEVAALLHDSDKKTQEMTGKLNEVRDLLWNNNLRESGVLQIYADREQANLLQWLKETKPGSLIRLMALCSNATANNNYGEMIQRKLNEECSFKILLLDSYSSFLDQRALEEPGEPEEFKTRVRHWAFMQLCFVKALEPKLAARMELACYRAAPVCFIADNERTMLVGFYLHGNRGEGCPHLMLEIKPGGAYERFRQHFESLWDKRAPLTIPVEEHVGLYARTAQESGGDQTRFETH